MADKPPEQSTMSAVHLADDGPDQLTKTPTARLSCMGMGMTPTEKKAAAPSAPKPAAPPPMMAHCLGLSPASERVFMKKVSLNCRRDTDNVYP